MVLAERFAFRASVFAVVFLPVIWSLGFSLRLYGYHPWPGVALYAHIFAFLLIVLFLVRLFAGFKLRSYFSLVLSFVFLIVLMSGANLIFKNKEYISEAFTQNLIYVFYFVFYVAVGFYLYRHKMHDFFLAAYMIFFLGLCFLFLDLNQTIPLSLYNMRGEFDEAIVNYQLISFSLVFLFFLVYRGFVEKREFFIFVLVLSLVFVTGGRSEFIGLLLSMVLVLFFVIFVSFLKRFSISRMNIYFIFLAVFIVLFSFVLVNYFPGFLNNRNFQIFDLDNASSVIARNEIMSINMIHIRENLLLGDFGSHFEMSRGSYIHNILSVWQQFGGLVFMLYVLIIYIPVIYFVFMYFKAEDKVYLNPLLISLYVAILLAATKSFFWPVAGLSVGVCLAFNLFSNKAVAGVNKGLL
ncbi:MAG: hypothetical protein IBX57_11695 [Gammaproteobacteria bacterium]|nr:hypothetical protein [Gammaproteobacteria bacterium]